MPRGLRFFALKYRLYAQYGWRKPGGRTSRWRDRDTVPFEMVSQRVKRYRHGWMKMQAPWFASTSRESPVHNESARRVRMGARGNLPARAGEGAARPPSASSARPPTMPVPRQVGR